MALNIGTKKIAELTALSELQDDDLFVVQRGEGTYKASKQIVRGACMHILDVPANMYSSKQTSAIALGANIVGDNVRRILTHVIGKDTIETVDDFSIFANSVEKILYPFLVIANGQTDVAGLYLSMLGPCFEPATGTTVYNCCAQAIASADGNYIYGAKRDVDVSYYKSTGQLVILCYLNVKAQNVVDGTFVDIDTIKVANNRKIMRFVFCNTDVIAQ